VKLSSIDSTQESGVSHNARIRKHVLVANGEIDHVINISRAVFPPGEVAHAHSHDDMTEVFIIESGQGVILVSGRSVPLEAGMCVVVEPNEVHELKNTGSTDMVVTCLGVET